MMIYMPNIFIAEKKINNNIKKHLSKLLTESNSCKETVENITNILKKQFMLSYLYFSKFCIDETMIYTFSDYTIFPVVLSNGFDGVCAILKNKFYIENPIFISTSYKAIFSTLSDISDSIIEIQMGKHNKNFN